MLGGEFSSLHIKNGSIDGQLIVPTVKWDQASRILFQLRLEPSLLIEGIHSTYLDSQEKNNNKR